MIIPDYTLNQSETHLLIDIRCPYIKVDDAEFAIEKQSFKFTAKPYHLNLELPCEIVDDSTEMESCEDSAAESALYDFSTGILHVELKKRNAENLAGIASISPRKNGMAVDRPVSSPSLSLKSAASQSAVENGHISTDIHERKPSDTSSRDDFNDFMPVYHSINWDSQSQEPYEMEKYGFNRKYNGVLCGLDQMPVLLDCFGVEDFECYRMENSIAQMRVLISRRESEDFDEDYFITDTLESVNDSFRHIIEHETWWQCCFSVVSFTPPDEDFLASLPRHSHQAILDDPQSIKDLILSLVSILYPYCYVYRVYMGDIGEEHIYSLIKLSPVMSTFLTPLSFEDLMISLFRRTSIYALYRCQQLYEVALKDLAMLLKQGKNSILKSLIHIHRIFSLDEDAWRLNTIWIDDFIQFVLRNSIVERYLREIGQKIDAIFNNNTKHISTGSFHVTDIDSIQIGEWFIGGLKSVAVCDDIRPE